MWNLFRTIIYLALYVNETDLIQELDLIAPLVYLDDYESLEAEVKIIQQKSHAGDDAEVIMFVCLTEC